MDMEPRHSLKCTVKASHCVIVNALLNTVPAVASLKHFNGVHELTEADPDLSSGDWS